MMGWSFEEQEIQSLILNFLDLTNKELPILVFQNPQMDIFSPNLISLEQFNKHFEVPFFCIGSKEPDELAFSFFQVKQLRCFLVVALRTGRPHPQTDSQAILNQADNNFYQAKFQGRYQTL